MFTNLRFLLKSKIIDVGKENTLEEENLFFESFKCIKNQRLSIGLSRAQLSQKTKISVAVIEAIENGWTKNLPEKTFLRPMLEVLENELNLKGNSLQKIISISPIKEDIDSIDYAKPLKANLFSKSQGIIIYTLFMLLSIFILNKYQLILSKNNLKTIAPILYNQIKVGTEIDNKIINTEDTNLN